MRNNVNKTAFFNILGPVILNGISFFTIPIFTRLLGTENYGIYTIYSTWVNVITILVGLQIMGTIGVANVRMDKTDCEKYYSSITFLILIHSSIWFIVYLTNVEFFEKLFDLPNQILILMLFHALGAVFVNFATNRFVYEKKAHLTCILSVGVALCGILLSLFLLTIFKNTKNIYFGRAYGAAVPYILFGLFYAVFLLRKGRTGFSKKYWGFCLSLSIPIVFHGLSQLILAQADKLMLRNILNNSTVGIYSFTFTFAHVLNIIYNAFNNTWVPYYYDDLKQNNIVAIQNKANNYTYIFTGLSMGFVLLAPDVIKFFGSKDFWSGIPLIPLFVLANFMIFLYSFPVNFEFYHKKTLHIAIGTAAAAILNCILNYLLIPVSGMTGAAIATLIAYCFLWLFHHLVAKYLLRQSYHYEIRMFMKPLTILIICCVITNILLPYMLIRWLMAIGVGIILLCHLSKVKTLF